MYTDMRGVMAKFPYIAGPEMSLDDAIFFMKECRVRHLPVVEGKDVVGVVSERDILANKEAHKDHTLYLGDIMSRSPFITKQDEFLLATIDTMIEKKYGCALVTDESGNLVGIFTTIDALRLLAKYLENDPDNSFKKIVTLQQAVEWM